MKHITTQDALRALEEAVAEKGEDYVYPDALRADGLNCQYTVDGQPACIVGHALVRLGVDPDVFEGHQVASFTADLAERIGIDLDPGAHRAMRAAQAEQDHGGKWIDALDRARGAMSHA